MSRLREWFFFGIRRCDERYGRGSEVGELWTALGLGGWDFFVVARWIISAGFVL